MNNDVSNRNCSFAYLALLDYCNYTNWILIRMLDFTPLFFNFSYLEGKQCVNSYLVFFFFNWTGNVKYDCNKYLYRKQSVIFSNYELADTSHIPINCKFPRLASVKSCLGIVSVKCKKRMTVYGNKIISSVPTLIFSNSSTSIIWHKIWHFILQGMLWCSRQ